MFYSVVVRHHFHFNDTCQRLGFGSYFQVNPIEPNETHLMWNFLETWKNIWKLNMVFKGGMETKKNEEIEYWSETAA